MSETVFSKGFMAILKKPMSEEEREEFNDTMYDNGSGLSVNYEGTIVYSEKREEDIYFFQVGVGTVPDLEKFRKQLDDYSINIEPNTIKYWMEIWYNGGDSNHDMLTLEEYRKKL